MNQHQNSSRKGGPRHSLFQLLAVAVVVLLLLAGQQLGILPELTGASVQPTLAPTSVPTAMPDTALTQGTFQPKSASSPIIEPQAIADYLFAHGELPDNFITKAQAQALGWDSSKNYLSDVAPGKSIGGDRFGNYEGLLPKENGRQYYEADCYYTSGKRNAHRIVYSNDGLVFYTSDHYESFRQMYPSQP